MLSLVCAKVEQGLSVGGLASGGGSNTATPPRTPTVPVRTCSMPRRSVKPAQPASHPPFPTHMFVQDICIIHLHIAGTFICSGSDVVLNISSDRNLRHVSIMWCLQCPQLATCGLWLYTLSCHLTCFVLHCLLCGI